MDRYFKSFDGTVIWTKDQGNSNGLPIVFCNSIGYDSTLWNRCAEYFAGNHRVILWDYRCHGNSKPPKDFTTLSIENHARDLEFVLKEHGIDKAVLVGHGIGVQVILEFYNKYPDKVSALVAICGSYENPVKTFLNFTTFKWIFPLLYRGINSTHLFLNYIWHNILLPLPLSKYLARWIAGNSHFLKAEDFRGYIQNLQGMDLKPLIMAINYARQHSAKDMLDAIKVPTLIIGGENDHITPLRVINTMHRLIANSELLIVNKGTHLALLEVPEFIHLRIEKFLKERISV